MGRVKFTKKMKKDYTVLMPMMLPIHFEFLKEVFVSHGYNFELLTTDSQDIVNEGLQDVHNDTCYPALLVIGQLINALKSGKYDPHKTALIITQTGGGCRASNYIHLLRKALKRCGYGYVPVVSLNVVGMEKNPGFKVTIPMLMKFGFSIAYADLLMWLSNQTRPYEKKKGDTDALIKHWTQKLLNSRLALTGKKFAQTMKDIAADFAKIDMNKEQKKVRVGVVGEIYIKYAKLGNNNLESFLASEGAEVVIPGLLDYLMYCSDNPATDLKLYGYGYIKAIGSKVLKKVMESMQNKIIEAVKSVKGFHVPTPFKEVKQMAQDFIDCGVKMGEGWLLTAEMIELINSGVPNVVCTQPFGCLPNHIVGKGMIRKILQKHPGANIVTIDYDPGATKINQENRIKLMLATAHLNNDDVSIKPRESRQRQIIYEPEYV